MMTSMSGFDPKDFDQRRSRRCRTFAAAVDRGVQGPAPSAFRANTAWTACPTRSRSSGSRASPG